VYNPAVSANRHESMAMCFRTKNALRIAILIGFSATALVGAAMWRYFRRQSGPSLATAQQLNEHAVATALRLAVSIQSLRVGSSDFHAAQTIAAEFGTEPYRNCWGTADCADGYFQRCAYMIPANKGWYRLLLKHPNLTHFGLTNWNGWATISIYRGVVTGYSFNIEYISKKGVWRGFGAEELGEIPKDREVQAVISTSYSIERNLLLVGSDSGFQLESSLTPAATEDEHKRAWHFEFRCLAERDGCGEICEVMPEAWQDFFRVRGHFDVEKYGEAYRFCTIH